MNTRKPRVFNDTKNNIRWIDYQTSGYNIIYNKPKDLLSLIEELNTWTTDHGIQNFIKPTEKLGDFFATILSFESENNSPVKLFSAYNNEKLIGAVLIDVTPMHIIHIIYITVNPKTRNKGYATRMISSIKSNPLYFSQINNTNGISANIHTDNTLSKKAFLKSKFLAKPTNQSTKTKGYQKYYFAIKPNKQNTYSLGD